MGSVMDPLGTSVVQEPTLREILKKFQKSMDSLSDTEERKRPGMTGRTGYGRESIPARPDASAFLPPSPSPGAESRD